MARWLHTNSLTFEILKTIGKGAILLSLLAAPNLGVALKPFLQKKDRGKKSYWRRQQAWRRLRERGLVQVRKRNGRDVLEITDLGSSILETPQLQPLATRLKKWDTHWHLLLFDIPESKGYQRRMFQKQLRQANYFPLQKSVFVSPIPFPDDLYAFILRLHLQDHILFLRGDTLGKAEKHARRFYAIG